MNERLKKVAKKLHNQIPSDDKLNRRYYKMINTFSDKNLKLYFDRFTASEKLYIIIYLHSLDKFGSVDVGDEIINKSYIFNAFEFTDDTQEVECEVCNGSGTVTCDHCNSGEERCDVCDGDGDVECENCDGSGCEECDDSGRVVCPNDCDAGNVTCSECQGQDQYPCDTCDGEGYSINEDSLKYYDFCGITWDKRTIDSLYNSYELHKKLPSEEITTLSQKGKLLILSAIEHYEELPSDIEAFSTYCSYIEPLLSSDIRMNADNTIRMSGINMFSDINY